MIFYNRHIFFASTIFALLIFVGTSIAEAQLLRNTCKPNRHCTSAAKPCQFDLDFGERVFIVGSDAAAAPSLGVAAFRVRLCTEVSDTCSVGVKTQALQVFAENTPGDFPYQMNLFNNDNGSALDTGGHTEIGPHRYLAVQCSTKRCRFAAQHCRKQLPFIMPSQ